jgi:hypothetical protein
MPPQHARGRCYNGLAKHGYDHRRRPTRAATPGEQLLPRAHRAISNPKAWMHSTHCCVSPEHLPQRHHRPRRLTAAWSEPGTH